MKNIAINPLSLGMSRLIYNLQGNWNLIEKFLNTPEGVMKEYDLKEDEKKSTTNSRHRATGQAGCR